MGSFLDPLADKILVGTLFISLTYMDLIPGLCLLVFRLLFTTCLSRYFLYTFFGSLCNGAWFVPISIYNSLREFHSQVHRPVCIRT